MTIRCLDGIENPKWCSNGDAKNEKVAKQMKMELEVELRLCSLSESLGMSICTE
jgi:hypothetical protein